MVISRHHHSREVCTEMDSGPVVQTTFGFRPGSNYSNQTLYWASSDNSIFVKKSES
jgi:uncharacterized protein YjdB